MNKDYRSNEQRRHDNVDQVSTRFVHEPVPNVLIFAPSTNRRALSNGMLRFFIAQIMIFGLINVTMKNLSIPLDRARRFVLGASIRTFRIGS
jgi:hypothetical protein